MNHETPLSRQRLSIFTSTTLGHDLSTALLNPKAKASRSRDEPSTMQHPPPPPPSPIGFPEYMAAEWRARREVTVAR
ncbi:hypothetical protein MMC13_002765 [Lambiella insularis]|nr:hypothetical protein [Lambiella insularis]